MLKGTTRSGFAFEIEDSRCNNMELLDALAGLDEGDGAQLSQVLRLLFTPQQKKQLYDHLRGPGGNVPLEKVAQELNDIFSSGSQAKNS